MKKKMERSGRKQSEQSFCELIGPAFSELLRRVGPPEQARRHFDAARVEFLKGLRATLDARIEQVSKRQAKGQKISVE
jgi:hypothetical protein